MISAQTEGVASGCKPGACRFRKHVGKKKRAMKASIASGASVRIFWEKKFTHMYGP